MIVGTAGHIDHGKTTLVKALTGVDTDRLPEEKRRGISIELGYAFLDVPGGDARIAFVDVPGHERLVATMLGGASGIDHALVLVAADDGVMPQTREHVAALALLETSSATLVVTKVDRVDATRVEAVAGEARALLEATSMQGAPVFAVAAVEGRGIAPLRDHLLASARTKTSTRSAAGDVEARPLRHDEPGDASRRDEASTSPPTRADALGFRLAVDRVFTLDGVGTVATGTAHAGRVRVGDALAAVPSAPAAPRAMRVRSVRADRGAVEHASAGRRVALNLAGVEKEAISRGGWLVDPRVALETDRLDASVVVWRDEAKPLRSGTVVHVHLGTSDTLASVAVLGAAGAGDASATGAHDAIAPGAAGRVQLVLRRPIGAWHGDRLVLRDASATRMVAGGRVLDPFAPARHRRSAARSAELDAWSLDGAEARLAGLVAAMPAGVPLDRWRRAEGLVEASLASVAREDSATSSSTSPEPARASDASVEIPEGSTSRTARSEPAIVVVGEGESAIAFSAASLAALEARAVASLDAFHRDRPDELGPDAARWRRLAAPRLGEVAWRAVVERAIESGRVARTNGRLHRPQHAVELSTIERRIGERVLPRLVEAGFDPPWVRTLAADLREPEPQLRAALLRLAQRGELHQVVKDLFYPPATMAEAAARVRGIAARDGAVTAAAFRDASGLGRKRAIQIVEYFDRVGYLRRVGDAHRLRGDGALFEAERPRAA